MGFYVKILLYQRFHTFFGNLPPFFYTFLKNVFSLYNQPLLMPHIKCHMFHRFCIGNFYIIMISHLFPSISHLFPTFFKNHFHNIIHLFKCSRNIYGLHKFSIRNPSKLAISHLFYRFNTFFLHLFQLFITLSVPLIHTNLLKKVMLIATPVLKFCLSTNFVTPYIHTDIWITIPRVDLKVLELISATKLYKVCMGFH